MSDPATWATTTHVWASSVDRAHLARIRADVARYGLGGRRHLILEVLAYADDEARPIARVGRATVTYRPDGRVTVTDDGRGTDTRTDGEGRFVRKPVMATRDVRFFDDAAAPVLPDGLRRRGMSVVAALSPVLVHENRRGEGAWRQEYRHGVPDETLETVRRS